MEIHRPRKSARGKRTGLESFTTPLVSARQIGKARLFNRF